MSSKDILRRLKIDALVEMHADHHTRIGRLEEFFVMLVELARSADERLDAFEHRINDVDDRFSDIDARLVTLSETVAALTAAGSHTDQRLNTLINIVERHISHNHGGANG